MDLIPAAKRDEWDVFIMDLLLEPTPRIVRRIIVAAIVDEGADLIMFEDEIIAIKMVRLRMRNDGNIDVIVALRQ